MESVLADEQDSTLRAKKESEMYKKKYVEANSEKTAAFQSLESYQQIFAKCEESLIKLQNAKEKAEKERD